MTEQQPPAGSPEPAATIARPAARVARDEVGRRHQVIWSSLLAGLGLGMAVALVMHVVQVASPIGYGMNIDGAVVVAVLIAGPIFGLGIGMALAALIPHDSTAQDR
jgi:hypothetical protein